MNLRNADVWGALAERKQMFSIHWLHERTVVQRQDSEFSLLADILSEARESVDAVRSRHRCNKPQTFKIFDPGGRELGHYPVWND
ncbi:MAG: hypothetical protein GC190_10005 [Alphaproteobacteria bacterium]|nr:hypothetical protein [Alphaproteobacteria bacterium]